MKDLKFEQKRTLSRREAADQLSALADALREGEDAELKLGAGTLTLRIPDGLRSEIEVEIGGGEAELEIEFKWSTGTEEPPSGSGKDTASSDTARTTSERRPKDAAATSGRGAGRSRTAKRPATKTS
ncbi:amphi-Trp domain-containing protein [Streptomyces sp. NPDC059720]|uniref:amphi-Trp domain-containing protein n=1 Tax=Streptomyces sp. NPDC059720 TaxID=3346924 RepID=UPI003693D854